MGWIKELLDLIKELLDLVKMGGLKNYEKVQFDKFERTLNDLRRTMTTEMHAAIRKKEVLEAGHMIDLAWTANFPKRTRELIAVRFSPISVAGCLDGFMKVYVSAGSYELFRACRTLILRHEAVKVEVFNNNSFDATVPLSKLNRVLQYQETFPEKFGNNN
ncbi:MAG TPA: hypothetical protein VLG40_01515 [Candidatus Saccharimonas sp.]|nr:hypothetical protein [Candidatus Saccharimonas sp.]